MAKTEKSGEDPDPQRWDRLQVMIGAVSLVLAAAALAPQFGLVKLASTPLDNNEAPPSRTGIVLEEIETRNAGGGQGPSLVRIVEPPRSGRWRSLLCEGDQIINIDGIVIDDVIQAQRILHVDQGQTVTVRSPDDRTVSVRSDGFRRC